MPNAVRCRLAWASLCLAALALSACGKNALRAPAADVGPEVPDAGAGDASPEAGLTPLPLQEVMAGERLRPLALQVGDAQVPDGFHDTLLDTPCNFLPTSDGLRCVPRGGRIVYLEPGCRTPVIRVQAGVWLGRGAPRHALAGVGSTFCDSAVSQVYERGAELASRPERVFVQGVGSCESWPVTPGDTLFALGDEVPLSSLVAEAETRHAGAGRLRASYRVGTDGSLERTGWYDELRGESCDFVRDELGAPRCMPRTFAYAAGEAYPDPQCEQPAYHVLFACDDQELASRMIDGEPCEEPRYQLLELKTYLTSTAYTSQGGSCSVYDESASVWSAEPLPGERFAPMLARPPTDARIQPSFELAEGLPDFLPGHGRYTYEDTQLNDLCALGRSEDQRVRCFPFTSWSREFSDAACTQPVQGLAPWACRTPSHVTHTDDAGVSRGLRVGAALAAGATVYVATDTGCEVAATAEAQQYRALSSAPPDSFVEATTVMR